MRINLKNTTTYRDEDLRRLARDACKHTGARVTALQFVVKHALKARVSGRASCKSGVRAQWIRAYMELTIPSPDKLNIDELMRVAIHEAMHLAGATHSSMTAEQRYCTFELPAWAKDYSLRENEPYDVVATLAAARQDRLEHARKMHRKALTRMKRAETIETRWRRTVLRLEKL